MFQNIEVKIRNVPIFNEVDDQPKNWQTAGPNVLATVTNSALKVGQELQNWSFVDDGATDALCNLQLVHFTVQIKNIKINLQRNS